MKQLTMDETLSLSRVARGLSISLYVDTQDYLKPQSPTVRAPLDRLLRNVDGLISRSFYGDLAKDILSSLKKSLEGLSVPKDTGGIGIYHNQSFSGYIKLPSPTRNLAVAAQSFHIKPVMHCAQVNRAYYMVVFRRNSTEVWHVHPDRLYRMMQARLPGSDGNNDGLNSPQNFPVTVRMIDKLKKVYQKDPLPIMLAGPLNRQEKFMDQTSRGFEFFTRKLTGNVDHLELRTLSRIAQPLINEHFKRLDMQAVQEFYQVEGSQLTSTQIFEIGRWVAQKKISTLMIAEDRHLWGTFDQKNGSIHLVPRSTGVSTDDVLDDLAEQVFNQGGKVLVLPTNLMPKGSAVAAISQPEFRSVERQYWKKPAKSGFDSLSLAV